jgi:uncharacterized membrane protein YccC
MRLRSAVRAGGAAATCALCLWLVHAPPETLIGGSILAAISEVATTERGERALVTLLLCIPCLCAALAITALVPEGILLVVFCAVWGRRLGPRGAALGLVSFLSGFQAIFLQLNAAAKLWPLFAAGCFGVICTIAWRFLVLPERKARLERLGEQAFAERAAAALRLMSEAILGGPPYEDDHRRREALGVLDEAALWLDDIGAAPEIRSRVLQWELATGALVQMARQQRTLQMAEALESLSRLEEPRSIAHSEEFDHAAGEYLAAARGEVQGDVYHLPKAPPRGQADALRIATQATVAVAIAMLLGKMVSPVRWYWAVIAAYVVFARGRNAGETLVRGIERVIGTALGIAAGMLTHVAIRGHPAITVALLFVCLVFAYERLRISYTAFVFFITNALALLYGSLGHYSNAVLLLRLEETAIGAIVGMVVAVLVLPADARGEIRATVVGLLRLAAGMLREPQPARARAIDRGLRDLRAAGAPVVLGMRYFGWHARAATLCREALMLGFFSRQLLRTPELHSDALADRTLRIATALAQHRAPEPEPVETHTAGFTHIEHTLAELEATTAALGDAHESG